MDFTDIQPLFLANYGYKPRCKLYNVRGRRYHLYPYAIQSLASKFLRLPWRIRHAVALHYWFFKFLKSPCTVTARYWEWLLTVWKAPSEDCFFPQPMFEYDAPRASWVHVSPGVWPVQLSGVTSHVWRYPVAVSLLTMPILNVLHVYVNVIHVLTQHKQYISKIWQNTL